MQKLFSAALIATLLISTLSCSSGSREFMVIDIDAPTGRVDLKLSDLLSDIKIVPLETGTNMPLISGEVGVPLISGGGFRVSSKYIVHYNSSAMYLFDSNGKYLRLLAVSGGGPNEFRAISRLLIDDNRDIIYYNDIKNSAMIYRINLLDGKHLEPLEVVLEKKNFSFYDIDSSGDICGFFASGGLNVIRFGSSTDSESSEDHGSYSIAHRYNVGNNTIEGIKASAVFSSTGMNRSIARYGEDICVYDSSYADTLFSYTEGELWPVMEIKMRDIMEDPMTGGYYLTVNLAGKQGFLLQHSYSKIDVTTGASGEVSSVSIRRPTVKYVFADKNSGALLTVNSFYIDPIGATIDILKALDEKLQEEQFLGISEFVKASGDYGYCLIDAYKMESLIEEALAGNKLSAQEKKSLENLAATITEESNPIIITGKIR
jgi:hypothetical protein